MSPAPARPRGSRVLLWAPLVALSCLPACSSSASHGRTVHGTVGGLDVQLDTDPARIVITAPDGTVLIDGLPGGSGGSGTPDIAAAFRHADASYEMMFGSFKIEETNADPWSGVTKLAAVKQAADGSLSFSLEGSHGALGKGRIEPTADGNLHLVLAGRDADDRASMAFKCNADDHFIGFGGQSFDVDQRGQTVPIWVSEDGIGKLPTDDIQGLWYLKGRRHTTHSPIPMYVTNRGYGLLLDTPYYSKFDMCSGNEHTVRIESWENKLDVTLFYGPDPATTVEKMTAAVGRPALPPPFAFAPWLDAIYGSQNVRDVAQALRGNDVPASVIWTEDWRGGAKDGLGYTLSESWEVDRNLYPDFEQVASDLHDEGYKFFTYNNTFLDSTEPVYQEAVKGGYTIKDDAGKPYLFSGVKFHDTSMADLSNPDAVAWVKKKYKEGLDLGADGYMADYGEWLPTDAKLASGDSAEARHNLYPVDFQRLNKQLFDSMHKADGVDRLFFVRSAYVGSQPLVSVVWGGDQQTDFSDGDGLPSVIPMGIGLGVTGFPYFGSDIAGYMSQGTQPSTKELFFRWTELGAFSPVMRTHHGKSAQANWNWEKDAATIALFKRYAKLHIQLFPYLDGLAKQASDKGTPMMRPLAYNYPDFSPGWSMTDEYMLGDRLIVAPVVKQGATKRDVQLPGGTFYPLEGGKPTTIPDGGGTTSAAAPLDQIPVFVPAGSVLVLLPDTVDTLVAAKPATGTVTLADVKDDRVLWLYPGGSSDWTEAGGLSYSWQADKLATAPSSATWNGQSVVINSGTIDVTGPGKLVLDGGKATLDVKGGAADRALSIVVR